MADVVVARGLTEFEAKLFGRMLSTVQRKRRRNKLKSDYLEAKKRLDKIGFSVPPRMIDFQTPLGWAYKGVSIPASRLRPNGFTLPRTSSLLDELSEILDDSYVAAVERMAIDSSLELSCAFVFTSPGDVENGEPEVIVAARTALEATAEIDARTNIVTAALEMVEAYKWLLYMPGLTLQVENVAGKWVVTEEYVAVAGVVGCTPYIWGRSLKRPFGRSRISRPLMGFIDSGVRTLLRQEVTAEFFSAPQRALLGADEAHFTGPDGQRISPLDALLGGVWALPDVFDEDEGKLVRPNLTQLQQASMQPHSEQLKTIGLMVASELDIPTTYLGIISDNPSSAEAILASESSMIAMIKNEWPSYSMSRVDLALKILAVKHGELTVGMKKELRGLKSRFLNPGTPTPASQADAALKFTQTFPEGDPEVAMEMYGMEQSQIDRMNNFRAKQTSGSLLEKLTAASKASMAPVFSDGTAVTDATDDRLKDAQVLRSQADAFSILSRAGVDRDAAAERAGLAGIKFTSGLPNANDAGPTS